MAEEPVCRYLERRGSEFLCAAAQRPVDPAFAPCLLSRRDRLYYCTDYARAESQRARDPVESASVLVESLTGCRLEARSGPTRRLATIVMVCRDGEEPVQTVPHRLLPDTLADYAAILLAVHRHLRR
jgi:hypothetical protein